MQGLAPIGKAVVYYQPYHKSRFIAFQNMSNIIRGKIDVSKIDKDRLFRGAKGTYLDIVLLPTEDSQYGDTHMIKQDVSKEDREAGVRGAILGNAKEIVKDSAPKAAPKADTRQAFREADSDLPF